MIGEIHSVETFGTVDGPGVRFVVFFQGCPMRCLYCHNPDTWGPADGSDADSGELIARMIRNRPFYQTGGITATGGEPMLQLPFLTDLFERAKAEGIHTALDTSGICFSPARRVEIDRMLPGDALFFVSVYTMRDSWRAGIAENDTTALVTNGIYAYSRNPAFLAFDLVYAGLLMMFFNVPLLLFSLFAAVMLHLQVLQEERFLAGAFGQPYLDYQRRVRRYLGRRASAHD